MVSCYNLIGKQILSLSRGSIIGVVKNVEIKNMKISKILAFNDLSDTGEEFLFDPRSVYNFGENAITLKRESFEIDPNYNSAKIVGAILYSQEGEIVDNIVDITFNEKTFKVESFIGEKQTYEPVKIFSLNDGVIVLKGNAKVAKTASIKNIAKSASEQTKVTILNNASAPNTLVDSNSITLNQNIVVNKNDVMGLAEPVNHEQKNYSTPQKTIANFGFLIGRIITKDLFINNGKFALKQGKIIDQKTVIKAFENNFLKQLIQNSR